MANSATTLGAAPKARLDTVAEGAFLALLLLIFVTLSPFQPPADVTAYGANVVNGSGAGDSMRQMSYLGVFGMILICAARKRGVEFITAVPLTVILLLAWCLASSYWSPIPDITLRRSGLAVIVVASTLISIDTIGASRAFVLWRNVLGAVLLINWISIPLIANARHLPGELDPELIGNWRGLYGHKNTAGAVSAFTAILFFFSAIDRRKWTDFGICLAAIVFLYFTRSKTSLGMLPAAIAAGCLYRWTWRAQMDRAIVLLAALFAALLVTVTAFVYSDAILHFLKDPNSLTGRTAIWQAEAAYIADHPYLGAGFGSFANTGDLSPLHDYLLLSWVGVVSHGHSGYLQMLVTIGGIGFGLAMIGMVLQPARLFLRQDGTNIAGKSLLFAMFVFAILHNVMETDFLESDQPAWVSFLIMLAMLRVTTREAPAMSRHA